MMIPIRFYHDLALLLRFYCAFAASATIQVVLTKISNRSGNAVQWNGGGGDTQDHSRMVSIPLCAEKIYLNADAANKQ